MGATKVLIVDDDRDVRRGLARRLRARGYDMVDAADAVHVRQPGSA